ncbi:MAG: biotin--[acetyl-CoA-carboxylase] ligase [Pseudomonadota bacterium]
MINQAERDAAAAIAAVCAAGPAARVALEVVLETGSTNADLLARLPALAGPTLLLARRQTAGRGRAGRSWLSDGDASLTFSLAWRLKGPLQRLAGLPLAVGVALAEALGALEVKVQLKWPNDLLKDGAKLGGILVETRAAPGGAVWAVVGVGLNLLMPDQLEARIGGPAGAAPWLARMERDALVAKLLAALAGCLEQFDGAGFGPFCARWNRLHAWQGEAVKIVENGLVLHEGSAAGVDDGGRLLLDGPKGRVAVVAGDVSLRRAEA